MQRGGPPRQWCLGGFVFSVRLRLRAMVMSRLAPLVSATLLVAAASACGGAAGPSSPASSGVRAFVTALRSDDPRGAYSLLSTDARKKLTYDQFALDWKQTGPERAWQAKALEESLKGNPDVGERALITFSDGKLVELQREAQAWHLESELVSRTRAKAPRDAIRLFADAIANRDVGAALGVLSARRREGLQRQIEGFIAGLAKHANGELEQSSDRAELRWDDGGLRYRIKLIKEDDEWRVDDIYIRPAPKTEEEQPSTQDSDLGDDF